MESPVKTTFRLARKSTCVGGVDVPAGTTVMVAPGAINRDPNVLKTRTSSGSTAPTFVST